MMKGIFWITVALAAVLGSFVAGPQLSSLQPSSHTDHAASDGSQVAEAAALPLSVDWHFKLKDKVGDAAVGSNVKIDDQYIDAEIHCEICTKIEFTPGRLGQAGLAYAFDKALDLTKAKSVTFFVMGEEGGEKLKVKVGGKGDSRNADAANERPGRTTDGGSANAKKLVPPGLFKQQFAVTTEEVEVTKDWKKFSVDVEGLDLKSVTHPFGLEFAGKKGAQKQVIIIKHVTFDTDPAVNPLAASTELASLSPAMSVDIIANATNATAPAEIEFRPNITGGIAPYELQWDFGNGNELDAEQEANESQTYTETFEEAGSYNVTLNVQDAGNQTGAASIEIMIGESVQNATEIALDIEANTTASESPATVEFEAAIDGESSDDFEFEWNFGDGETGQGESVTHTFNEPGEYNVTANATGLDDMNGSDWIAIEVTEGAPQNDTLQDTDALADNSSDTENNIAPTASAVDTVLAYPGDEVILDASESIDEEGDEITFSWVQSTGPEVELADEDTATPWITIPDDIEQDEEVVMEVTASDASLSSEPYRVTIIIDHVQAFFDAQEDDSLDESLLAPESMESVSEWETDCEEIPECLSDEEEDTVVAAGPESSDDSELMLSFEDLETSDSEQAEIRYIELSLDASKSGDAGYLSFILPEEGDEEPFTSDPVSIVADPDEFGEYRLLLEEDPRSGREWTVEAVNDLVAGISFGGGSSDVSVSEIALTVVYESLAGEESDSESEEEASLEDENNVEEVSEDDQSTPEQEEPTGAESEEEGQESVEDPSTNSTES